jgi:hypothetical protein
MKVTVRRKGAMLLLGRILMSMLQQQPRVRLRVRLTTAAEASLDHIDGRISREQRDEIISGASGR